MLDLLVEHVEGFFTNLPTEFFINTKPVPASRPRVSRWGTFYGKNYTNWRKEAADILNGMPESRLEGPLFVITKVVCPKPKTSKRDYPRGDTDNYEKAVWDSITSSDVGWIDDDQIVINLTYKRFAEQGEACGVYVSIYQINGEYDVPD